MPSKAKHPCGYQSCPELTHERYCEIHKKPMAARYNKYERDPLTNKRYGKTWRKIRGLFIAAHPLCETCKEQGRLTPAKEVHHIIPLAKGGDNNPSNLMSLCKSCHSRITAESGDRW
jgi:5-methylcytosine-specific restriction protein A